MRHSERTGADEPVVPSEKATRGLHRTIVSTLTDSGSARSDVRVHLSRKLAGDRVLRDARVAVVKPVEHRRGDDLTRRRTDLSRARMQEYEKWWPFDCPETALAVEELVDNDDRGLTIRLSMQAVRCGPRGAPRRRLDEGRNDAGVADRDAHAMGSGQTEPHQPRHTWSATDAVTMAAPSSIAIFVIVPISSPVTSS